MTPPDLTTKAGRKAYKHEMRMIAVRPRRIGMALLALGLLLLVLPMAVDVHSIGGWSPRFLGLVLVALALPFLIAATWLRGRYHRHRLGSS
ncbi:hypothetical protein BH10PSE12_BH10PSE12_29110 [soil metagenome]